MMKSARMLISGLKIVIKEHQLLGDKILIIVLLPQIVKVAVLVDEPRDIKSDPT